MRVNRNDIGSKSKPFAHHQPEPELRLRSSSPAASKWLENVFQTGEGAITVNTTAVVTSFRHPKQFNLLILICMQVPGTMVCVFGKGRPLNKLLTPSFWKM